MSIINSVQNFGTSAYNKCANMCTKENGKRLIKATIAVAIPAIALFALTSIPVAKANPEHYKSCIKGCDALPPSPFKIACYLACLVTLPIP